MQPTETYNPDKQKLLSALCHGSILFSTLFVAIGLPISIFFVSDDSIVKANAKEAINFHLNVWFWGAIVVTLSFLTLGLLGLILGPIGYIIHWGLTFWAIAHTISTPNSPFSYPFIFRVF